MTGTTPATSATSGKTRFRDRGRFGQALVTTLVFLAVLWAVQIINWASGNRLVSLGIHPLDFSRFWGILPAPFIHVNFSHLIANTPAVAVLLFLVALSGQKAVWASTIVTTIVAGVGVFFFGGENTVHVGASILIYGWAVFLAVRGFFTRSIPEVLLGIVVIVVYAGLFWGILPNQPGVSWQGHLFGGVGGAMTAWGAGRPAVKQRQQAKAVNAKA
ncbi:MAG: rhomboid family intramembrane serine protease [Corynebacterium sp.]|jgi:membrane associated rhomboid family serine protease|uniref:rhomboid family intramembrane serine protease n=1 Tax=unclassified Corynebacterium TaxID=2624378 RepID=UPI0009FB3C93|nr:rhomboid family intramembrane serine protease [Corynebacterium sp. CNJ-954]